MSVFTGGCACGALRYSATGEPLAMVECQCLDCRKDSGTGHASHVVFLRDGVTLTGTASHYEMPTDGGGRKTRGFCPTCGSPVTMTFSANPAILAVRAGSLDEPARYRPQIVTYTARALPWDHVDPALPAFAGMPTA